ncbi:MAG TPA: VCBS repeat-containing protein [Cyclobacteriaceae bacterium]|nr:VCBS repeat-containing protein [Cyclobacteriaceae bacterium]
MEKINKWIERIQLPIFLLTVLMACGSPEKQHAGDHLSDSVAVLAGEQLSRKYCQSCHLYPEPRSLDKYTWERSVLPLMGRLFGIYEESVPRSEVIKGALNPKLVTELQLFPEQQTISDEEWKKIVAYYISQAPDSADFSQPNVFSSVPIDDFEVLRPYKGEDVLATTLIKADLDQSLIYIGGSKGALGFLNIYDNHFDLIDEIKLPSPPTTINIGENHLAITLAGSLRLAASNNQFGELIYLFRNSGEEKYSSYRKFLSQLSRPVQAIFEDFKGKGFEDILVAEFGYYTGSLTLYEHSASNRDLFKRTVLANRPGAIRVEVADMNEDGHKDIVALFAQGDEKISIFYGDGEGGFREETVLRFEPTYGSVYFELVDLNKDGFLDILYANGDNGDYPPVLKDYHGIRIFENDGENNFRQAYFFPMHGVVKASAADFDLDGALDIFAISYFPDPHAGNRSDLVLLHNEGDNSFQPKILQEEIPVRWITFDIADLDGDGYQDVLLGSMGSFQSVSFPKQNKPDPRSSLILLKSRQK